MSYVRSYLSILCKRVSYFFKTRQVLFAAVLFVCLTFLSSAAQAAPSLDDNGYYQLNSGDDLVWFGTEVNSGNGAIKGILISDVNLQSTAWEAIGTALHPFVGVFDGNGKLVTNLSIDDTDGTGRAFAGFFGNVTLDDKGNVGTVKNLTLDGVQFIVTRKAVEVNAGALAANSSGGIFQNCTVTNVDMKLEANGVQAGGAVGSAGNYALLQGITVQDIAIDAINADSLNGTLYAGGIAGSLSSYARIVGSTAVDGTIAATAGKTNQTGGADSAAVGGVVGYMSAYDPSVLGSSAHNMRLEADSYSYSYAGGIAGGSRTYGALIDGCNVSEISAVVKARQLAGASNPGNEYGYVGGVSGHNGGVIRNCTVSSSVLYVWGAPMECIKLYAGGIAGNSGGSTAELSSVFVSGTSVIAENESAGMSSESLTYSGGIAGDNSGKIMNAVVEDSDIEANLNTKYTGSSSSGGVSYSKAEAAVGGIVGMNGGYFDSGTIESSTVMNVTLEAKREKDDIVVTWTVVGSSPLGAIAGVNLENSTIANSLYESGILPGDIAVGSGDVDASVTVFDDGGKAVSFSLDTSFLLFDALGDSKDLNVLAHLGSDAGLTYTWSSSDEAFAQVSGSGTSATVTMLSEYGIAEVVCKIEGGLTPVELVCTVLSSQGSEAPKGESSGPGTDTGDGTSQPDGGTGGSSSVSGGGGGCSAFGASLLLLMPLLAAAVRSKRK